MAQKHDTPEYVDAPMTRAGTLELVASRRQIRSDAFTAARWAAVNPILQLGEIGYETDTNKLKVGDGVTEWNNLGYVGGGSSLPDQDGHSGEFLTTDGTDASWAAVDALQNNANPAVSASALAVGANTQQANVDATSYWSIAVGGGAGITNAYDAVVIGANARATTGANTSIAIGPGAYVSAAHAIQISAKDRGVAIINSDANTFKVHNGVANYELLSADGTVPTARLTKVNTTATLAVADWSSSTQTVTVSGVKADSVVFVSPAPASASDYASAGILCTSQGTDSLTFTCTTTPTNAITVNVVCM